MPRYSQELLLQARMLATLDTLRPKQANLRRSISSSYYAIFHFLIEEATFLTVGTQHGQSPLRHFAGRAFNHGRMKDVCEEFKKTTPASKSLKPWWSKLPVSTTPTVKVVADAFLQLQSLRHSADYDMESLFLRSDALNAADSAHDAMQAWKSLKIGEPRIAQLFALALALWPGMSGR